MKEEKKSNKLPEYQFVFNYKLIDKGITEQDFNIEVRDCFLSTAKDKIETFLTHEWGYITKRTYRNEDLQSERYWEATLVRIIFIEK